MGELVQFVTPLHQATSRAYIDRMVDDKVHCMLKAKEYETDYWDGDRRYGYGGYKFIPGRWKPVAEALIEHFDLRGDSSVLDVGCGAGRLTRIMTEMGATVTGIEPGERQLERARAHPVIGTESYIEGTAERLPVEDNCATIIIFFNSLPWFLLFKISIDCS